MADFDNNTIVEEPPIDEVSHINNFEDNDQTNNETNESDHNQIINDERVLRDVIMWRNKKVNVLILLVATILWVLLQVYHFNFIPLLSWTSMAFITLLFLYASLLRLLNKEVHVPNMVAWEMSEERAKEMGESTKRVMEKGVKWMFYVSCEREWYFFVAVTFGLLLLAYIGHYIHLLTLLYTGTLVGMTIRAVYVNKEEEIKLYHEKMKVQAWRMYNKLGENVFSKFNLKKKEKKSKKVE